MHTTPTAVVTGRVLLVLALAVALAACGEGGDGGAAEDDVLRRTVLSFEVQSRGLLEMDLRDDPPRMQPSHEQETTRVEVVDLDAARELRSRLLALPPVDGQCPLTVEPLFNATVATFPTAEDAPFADLAVHEVGGPCSDLGRDQVQELVDLWNRAGGSLTFDPPA